MNTFDYLTDSMFIDSQSGIAIVPINKYADSNPIEDISLWDLRSGKLIESIQLANRKYHSAPDNIQVIGFEDSNTILILTWDQNDAYTKPALIEYKIKERKESLRWSEGPLSFTIFDYSFPAMTALAGIYGYPYYWQVLDLKTGLLSPMENSSVSSSDRRVFSSNGQFLFGATTKSDTLDWRTFKIDFTRWNVKDLNQETIVSTFDASDFNIATNVNRYQNSVRDIQAGVEGTSLYISSQIEFANHSVKNFLNYVDLGSGKKTTCPYSVNGRINFEIVDSNNNKLLVSDSVLGNYHPVFMNAKTCKTEALSHMDGFSDEKYPPKLRATKIKDRAILFNYKNVWDAQTGKVVLKMCQ